MLKIWLISCSLINSYTIVFQDDRLTLLLTLYGHILSACRQCYYATICALPAKGQCFQDKLLVKLSGMYLTAEEFTDGAAENLPSVRWSRVWGKTTAFQLHFPPFACRIYHLSEIPSRFVAFILYCTFKSMRSEGYDAERSKSKVHGYITTYIEGQMNGTLM